MQQLLSKFSPSPALHNEMVPLRKQLMDFQAQAIREFWASPEGQVIRASTVTSGSGPSVEFDNQGKIVVTWVPTIDWVKASREHKPPLDSRLINTLLHGKLLTDEEKRELLVSQGVKLGAAKDA